MLANRIKMLSISAKNKEGVNGTALIDKDLWKFLLVGIGSDDDARQWIKELISKQERKTNSQLNQYIKVEIYKFIAKPWIVRNLDENKELS